MASASRNVAIIVCLLLLLGAAPGRGAAAMTTTPIQHVIIVVQENHTFDDYFGTYPTANGTLVTPITAQLPTVNGIPKGVCLPYGNGCVKPSLVSSSSTEPTNPVEGQLVYERDYANNATGFANNSGIQSLVYFDYHDIPAYWDYAEEYGLADNYFAPALTQSNPNRLMLLTGDSPVASDNGPPPSISYNKTLMSQLDGAGLSWGYFDWIVANGTQSVVHPLDYISGMTSQAVNDIQDIPTLSKDLASGTGLPNVSFVNSLDNKTLDEHPPYTPATGEKWVVSLINQAMSSSYWNSTAIFLTWDEGGGFYDHVVPPSEYTINNTGFASPLLGFGQRIPLLVISPYSREAYVSNTLMSHLSLDHFIEYNWGLPSLNQRVADSSLPLGFFDFSQAPRPPVILGTSGPYSMTTYPVPLRIPLSPSTTTVTTTLTSTQTLPVSTTTSVLTTTLPSTVTQTVTSTVTSTTASPNTASSSSSTSSSSAISWGYVAIVAFDAALMLMAGGLVAAGKKNRR